MGGFLGLELPAYNNFPYPEGDCCAWLNSGRAALECLLINMKRPARVFVPAYICHTLIEPLLRLQIPFEFYSCQADLSPILPTQAKEDDAIILVNYFGLTGAHVAAAAPQFPGTVIVDATSALFCPPLPGIRTFYSPRKFVGVSDGGIALSPEPLPLRPEQQDLSAPHALYLLQCLEQGVPAAEKACQQAEDRLSGPALTMSPLTRTLLKAIDFEQVAALRCQHYMLLHDALAPLNRLSLPTTAPYAPMCYPFVSGIPGLRDDLIDAGVALPLFWPEVIEREPAHSIENMLARSLLPLPLDQRLQNIQIRDLIHKIAP